MSPPGQGRRDSWMPRPVAAAAPLCAAQLPDRARHEAGQVEQLRLQRLRRPVKVPVAILPGSRIPKLPRIPRLCPAFLLLLLCICKQSYTTASIPRIPLLARYTSAQHFHPPYMLCGTMQEPLAVVVQQRHARIGHAGHSPTVSYAERRAALSGIPSCAAALCAPTGPPPGSAGAGFVAGAVL